MSDFVEALRLELAHLEAEMQADPRWAKIERIKGLLDLYSRAHSEAKPVDVPTSEVVEPDLRNEVSAETKLLSKAAQIKIEVERLLTERPVMHRKAILEHLIQVGLMGKEKNPLTNLAAYLSDWRDLFAPDGSGNFMLRSRAVADRAPSLPLNPH